MLRKQSNHPKTQRLWSRWLLVAFFALSGALTVRTSTAQEIPQKVLEKNSLAASHFNNEDFEDALPHLRWLLDNAPTVYNSERIHQRAVTAYSALSESTTDESLESAYLDSALTVLRTAPDTFKQGGVDYNRVRWENDFGNFLVKYGARLSGQRDEAVDHFRIAYDLDPANTDPYYVHMIVREYLRLDRTDEALSFMDDAETHFGDDPEMTARFDEIRNQAIRSPEDRITYLTGKLANDSTDVQTARELFTIYSQLGRMADMERMGEFLIDLDPSTETYIQIADLKAENGEYHEALRLYAAALESAGAASESDPAEPTLVRDVEFKMAVSNYELGRLEGAKRHAVRAINQDKKFGNAYILIGDILVKAVSESAFERKDKAVYWLAMDYYEMAASVDLDVRDTARNKVQQYRAYMPTDEEKFFAGWETGEEYAVDYGEYAWVDETTVVR